MKFPMRVCKKCLPEAGVLAQMRHIDQKSKPLPDPKILAIRKALFRNLDLAELYRELEEAIREERYEDAALIRDLIERVEESKSI